MTTAEATTATLIAEFRTALSEIEAILAPSGCAMVAAQNWIVVDDFGPLRFTLTPEGKRHRAICSGHGRAHKVNRFTREDAERLAQRPQQVLEQIIDTRRAGLRARLRL